MPSHVRVALPEDVAAELVSERLAVRPIVTRGSTAADIISVVVDAANTGSAIVSIAVAGQTCRRIAKSFMVRRGRDDDQVDLKISIGNETRSLRVHRGDPKAEDRIVDFLLTTLSA